MRLYQLQWRKLTGALIQRPIQADTHDSLIRCAALDHGHLSCCCEVNLDTAPRKRHKQIPTDNSCIKIHIRKSCCSRAEEWVAPFGTLGPWEVCHEDAESCRYILLTCKGPSIEGIDVISHKVPVSLNTKIAALFTDQLSKLLNLFVHRDVLKIALGAPSVERL